MKYAVLLLALMVLASCAVNRTATAEEEYLVSAYDTKGRLLSKRVELGGTKAAVPIARDTLCRVHPRGIIRVHNKHTKELVKEYKPHLCSGMVQSRPDYYRKAT